MLDTFDKYSGSSFLSPDVLAGFGRALRSIRVDVCRDRTVGLDPPKKSEVVGAQHSQLSATCLSIRKRWQRHQRRAELKIARISRRPP